MRIRVFVCEFVFLCCVDFVRYDWFSWGSVVIDGKNMCELICIFCVYFFYMCDLVSYGIFE